MSTRNVSHHQNSLTYARPMKKKNGNGWEGWPARYKSMVRAKQLKLSDVAERAGVAVSTVRSWTNANRNIKLHWFFTLCKAADVDPAVVLFGGQVDKDFLDIGEAWRHAESHERESFILAAEAILARHGIARRRAS